MDESQIYQGDEVQVYQIDSEGFLIDILIAKRGEVLMETVQIGEEQIVDEFENVYYIPIYETRPRQDIVYKELPSGLFKPKWDGEDWVNGLSPEEIEELRNQPLEKTPEQEKIESLDEEVLIALEALAYQYEQILVYKNRLEEVERKVNSGV